MTFKYFSKNGEVRPMEEAVIPLSNIEYSYGFGVYENIRVHGGLPYFLKDHLERLEESARTIGLEYSFDEPFVGKSIADLIERLGAGTYNLKILLIGAKVRDDATLFILPLNPHFPDKKLYRDGGNFITYAYERPFPHAKTLNMLQSYLAYTEARDAGCYDALLVNSRGCFTEGTRTNFFCTRERTLISPPENEILLGVTRKAVLEVAMKNGFTLEEKDIPVSDLSIYDGAFITSTSSKIIPVRRVDSFSFAAVPAELKRLMGAYDAFLSDCAGVLT